MDVVKLLIGPDRVHVRVDPVTGFDVIFGKGKAFPLGKGVNYFTDSSFHVLDRETHRSFNAVEVVVDSCALFDEQGGGNTTEPKFRSKVHLEEILDLLDGPFGLTRIQQRLVAGWHEYSHTIFSGRICGKKRTSWMVVWPVMNMVRRSIPIPSPEVGGMPYSRARTKS